MAVVALMVAACGTPPAPTASPTPAPSSAAPATSSPSPSPSAPSAATSLAWTEAAVDPDVFAGALVMRLASGPGLVVAFGRDRATLDPVVWTSPDGRAWIRRPEPPDVFGGGVPDAAAVTAHGVVALGWGPDPGVRRREIWTSPDGVTWTRDPYASGRLGDVTLAFTVHGGMVLAAGTEGRQGVLLRSTDLEHWVDLSESPILDPYRGSLILPTAAGFLALTTSDHLLSAWTSADGEQWAEASTMVDAWAGVAAVTPGGIAVAGNDNASGTTTAAMWASTDGRAWQPRNDASDGMLGGDFRSTLVAIDGGVVGLALAPDPATNGSPPGPTVVASRDLRTWARLPFPAPDLVVGSWHDLAVPVDGHLLVLGWDPGSGRVRGWEASFSAAPPAVSPGPAASPGPSPAATLSWRPVDATAVFGGGLASTQLAALPGRLVATARRGARLHAWVSTDHGLRWSEAPDQAALRAGTILGLERVGSRLIGVGTVDGPDGTTRPVSWVTTDGLRWTRSAVLGNEGSMTAVAAKDGLIVAVGNRQLDPQQPDVPTTWTSRDGLRWVRAGTIEAPAGSTLSAVIAGGPGWIAGGANDQTAMIWTSADGVTWAPVADDSAFRVAGADFYFQGSITGLAALPDRLVAIGTVAIGGIWAEAAGAVFESPDGLTWSRLPDDPAMRAAAPAAVVAAGGHATFVARANGGPVAWTTSDGLRWMAADALDAQGAGGLSGVHIDDVTADGDRLVAIGARDQRPTLWFPVPAGTVVPDHTCGAAPSTISALAALSVEQRVACLSGRVLTVRAWVTYSTGECGSVDPAGVSTPVAPDEATCQPIATASAVDGGPELLRFIVDARAPSRLLERGGELRLRLRYGVVSSSCVPAADPAVPYPFAADPTAWLRLTCAASPQLVGVSRLP